MVRQVVVCHWPVPGMKGRGVDFLGLYKPHSPGVGEGEIVQFQSLIVMLDSLLIWRIISHFTFRRS